MDTCESCLTNWDRLSYGNGTFYCVQCNGGTGCYQCDAANGGCKNCHWKYGRVFDSNLGYFVCKPCSLKDCIICDGDETVCTACYLHYSNLNGFYLDYLTDGSQICRPMCARKHQFDIPSRALVLASNTCEKCNDPFCKKCLNDTLICEVCQPTHYMSNDICTKKCNDNEALKVDENECYPCSSKSIPNCNKCLNDTFNCQGCISGFTYIPDQDLCKKDCLIDEGYVPSTNTCPKCSASTQNCLECQNESLHCTKCLPGFEPQTAPKSFCKRTCQADEGYVKVSNTCIKCSTLDPLCTSCSENNSGTMICSSCSNGFTPLTTPRIYCKRDCLVNEAYVYKDNSCVICESQLTNCLTCQDETFQCSSCRPGYTALPAPQNLCKRDCQDNEGYMAISNTCLLCSSKTDLCTKCLDNSLKCTLCEDGYRALPTGDFCRKACAFNEGYVSKDNNCYECSSKVAKCERCS